MIAYQKKLQAESAFRLELLRTKAQQLRKGEGALAITPAEINQSPIQKLKRAWKSTNLDPRAELASPRFPA